MSDCFPGDKEMMNHVDSRCKNLLDDNDYNTVMTQIKMVNKNLYVDTLETGMKHSGENINHVHVLETKHLHGFDSSTPQEQEEFVVGGWVVGRLGNGLLQILRYVKLFIYKILVQR